MIPNSIFQIITNFAPNMQGIQSVNSPDEVAQMLLNSGKVNQMQVDRAKQLWNQPQIRQMIQSKYKY